MNRVFILEDFSVCDLLSLKTSFCSFFSAEWLCEVVENSQEDCLEGTVDELLKQNAKLHSTVLISDDYLLQYQHYE